jgi:hypothetical protein
MCGTGYKIPNHVRPKLSGDGLRVGPISLAETQILGELASPRLDPVFWEEGGRAE